MKVKKLKLSSTLQIFPAYYISFRLLCMSVSYFYTIVGDSSWRGVVEFFYLLCKIALGISLLMLFHKNRITWDSVAVTLLLWGIYGITLLVFPQNKPYLLELYQEMIYGNMVYLIARGRLISTKDVVNMCTVLSKILIILICVSLFRLEQPVYYFNSHYMTFANALLLPLSFLINAVAKKVRVWDVFLLFTGCLLLLLFGTRGAILILSLQALVVFWRKIHKMGTRYVAIMVSIILILCVLLILTGDFESNIFQMNISSVSRTIQKLLSGEFFDSSRYQIWGFLLEKSLKDTFLGAGLAGDRYYLHIKFSGTMANYAHNLFFEWMVDFGILGIVAFCILTKVCISTLRAIKNEEEWYYYVLLMFTSYGFLMFSSSWITLMGFYLLCAETVNIRVTKQMSKWKRRKNG